MFFTKIFFLVLLNLMDLVCSAMLYKEVGTEFELNPIAKFIMEKSGIPGMVLFKLAAVLVILRILINKRNEKGVSLFLNVLIGISFLGGGSALLAILQY